MKEEKIIEWPVVEMSLKELSPAAYNARTISKKAKDGLQKSLERFGMVQVIVWNKRSGSIVGGHQRYDLLLSAGVETTSVKVVDYTEEEEKQLNITLNNQNIQGVFDDTIGELINDIGNDNQDLISDLNMDDLASQLDIELTFKEEDEEDAAGILEEVQNEDEEEELQEETDSISDNNDVEIFSEANAEYHIGEGVIKVGESNDSRIQADKLRKYWSIMVHGEKADWQEMTCQVS